MREDRTLTSSLLRFGGVRAPTSRGQRCGSARGVEVTGAWWADNAPLRSWHALSLWICNPGVRGRGERERATRSRCRHKDRLNVVERVPASSASDRNTSMSEQCIDLTEDCGSGEGGDGTIDLTVVTDGAGNSSGGGEGSSFMASGAGSSSQATAHGEIAALMQLGFSEKRVRRALHLAHGRMEVAAQYLFEGVDDTAKNHTVLCATEGPTDLPSCDRKRRRIAMPTKLSPTSSLPLGFLLDDEHFHQACADAHRYERKLSSDAVLESLEKMAAEKPDFMQIAAANPGAMIQLVASYDEAIDRHVV